MKPVYSPEMRWWNWTMFFGNLFYSVAHIVQTQYQYDGLAQTSAEIFSLASAAIMLIVVLAMESPKRGLFFGYCRFDRRFGKVMGEYHGYYISWAMTYTYWFHPCEGTMGHLAGFFYMFMIFAQSAFIFNTAHINKWWKFAIEVAVLPHGVMVALSGHQNPSPWRMFGFGFGTVLVVTQIYGLGFNAWQKAGFWITYVIAVCWAFWWSGYTSTSSTGT